MYGMVAEGLVPQNSKQVWDKWSKKEQFNWKSYMLTQAYDNFVRALEKYSLIIETDSGSNDLAWHTGNVQVCCQPLRHTQCSI